ncbi:MAG: RHS repeat-associated core domain-containing protein [Dyella sp.]|uniref:RHS repeat-associated core domain-containing protein n=1 Tax=Dyella sp. TaxID=1869338 RepID=UPI003F81219F
MSIPFRALSLAILFACTAQAVHAQTTSGQSSYFGAPYTASNLPGPNSFQDIASAMRAIDNTYLVIDPTHGCAPIVHKLTDPLSSKPYGNVLTDSPNAPCSGSNSVMASLYSYAPGKNLGRIRDGQPQASSLDGSIHYGTGNEFLEEEDASLGALSFRRYYNSHPATASSHIGNHWRHSFDRSLSYVASSDGAAAIVTAFRADGLQETFNLQSGQWVADPDIADRLTSQTDNSGHITGWTLLDAVSRNVETYDANGLLQSIVRPDGQAVVLSYSTAAMPAPGTSALGLLLQVSDSHGRAIRFAYTNQGQIQTIQLPDGLMLGYNYDANGNLSAVRQTDGSNHSYMYAEMQYSSTNLPYLLTGETDETGNRVATMTYDYSGRATSLKLAYNSSALQVSYAGPGQATVTYPSGVQVGLQFVAPFGTLHVNALNASCSSCTQSYYATAAFDGNGYPSSRTDFNGNTTQMLYDANGLLQQQIEGANSPTSRITKFTWDTNFRVPLTRTISDAYGTVLSSTQWAYDGNGRMMARCETDPAQTGSGYSCASSGPVPASVRRWTYVYCTAIDNVQCPQIGLLTAVIGPRTDIQSRTTYSYYANGDLHSITDPLGHVATMVGYDGDGRVTHMIDANGVATDFSYTPRGWLASRAVNGATTTLSYTPFGMVASIADADGVTTRYNYDPAHNLALVMDAMGNAVQYNVDPFGEIIGEYTYDSSNQLRRTQSRSWNPLGQITQLTDGRNQVFNANWGDSYDRDGNLTHSADALNTQHMAAYDSLNHLLRTVDNGNDGSTSNVTVNYMYDPLGHLMSMTDPSGFMSSYHYDGLSDRIDEITPDAGHVGRAYDQAGNLMTIWDSMRSVNYRYDALNRITQASYVDGSSSVFYYDEPNGTTGCSNSYPIGRLTRVMEAAVTTTYCYDAQGRVIQKMQTVVNGKIDSTTYDRTPAGRIKGITYPSQNHLYYSFDPDGRIQGISMSLANGGANTPVVSNVSYLPFGPVQSYTLGNGQMITRTYDTSYRVSDLSSPAFQLHMARDPAGNVIAIGSGPNANPVIETYRYDGLNRLTTIADANNNVIESVFYNQAGDRLSKSGTGLATGSYSYNNGTHQLIAAGNAMRNVDPVGNTTSIAQAGNTYGFSYDPQNHLGLLQLNQTPLAFYSYNTKGERVAKTINNVSQRYVYDGQGRLLGEYGNSNRDYIWLDMIPVANADMSPATSSLVFVTADHQGTPRAISDASGNTIWQWPYAGGNAWGELSPKSNGYVYNLRYTGQYFDSESNLVYAAGRFYDPTTGRFLQNDPWGTGNKMGAYIFARNNPLADQDARPLPTSQGNILSGWLATSPAWMESAIEPSMPH